MIETQVLIAGAGPAGLSLAADLAWRGIGSIIVEPRIGEESHPRAISIGVRTMEHFRRLGIEDAVINAGVPRTRALSVVYTSRIARPEIFRFDIPSVDDLEHNQTELAAQTPEIGASPYYKIWTAQGPLERVLRNHVSARPEVELRTGWSLESFFEEDGGVLATILHIESGRRETVRCSHLAGCDGSASLVRKTLGISLTGRGILGVARGVYFRSSTLASHLGPNPGVMYWVLAPDAACVLYTIDGGDEWVINRYYSSEDDADRGDARAIVEAAVGASLELEILSDQQWYPRQLVAESFGTKRVFLAGDACHLFVPTGGFGMNTGIGDAVDLAWKIEAVLKGWGGEKLLASYDLERRPVGTRNTLEAADNYYKSGELLFGMEAVESDSREGKRLRAELCKRLPSKIKHFAPIGVHLGYRYSDSPIIVPDGTPEPPHEVATHTPTARPGHRAPHIWLKPGRSTIDLFGQGFVLLVFRGGRADLNPLLEAARAIALPLRIEEIDIDAVARLYETRLVLVRPDGHVAWRSETPPEMPARLLNQIRGA